MGGKLVIFSNSSTCQVSSQDPPESISAKRLACILGKKSQEELRELNITLERSTSSSDSDDEETAVKPSPPKKFKKQRNSNLVRLQNWSLFVGNCQRLNCHKRPKGAPWLTDIFLWFWQPFSFYVCKNTTSSFEFGHTRNYPLYSLRTRLFTRISLK